MRMYVELYFSSEGTNPLEILDKMKDLGFDPVVGEYDFAKDYETPEEYEEILNDLTQVLEGTDTRYRLTTRKK
ncbi:MAG: hypothetical protein KGY66_05525 [Candidatus Thermoplasmatota archaeon]|nr:hypothetical protein [Candidatus Thermoplasmatota archaeon]MBS3790359.1 hypothetical protein [Candidatus Thermoplasmatota archaeon]